MKKFYFFAVLVFSFQLSAAPLKVVILRHGQKLDQSIPGPYLSSCGMEYASKLPSYFAQNFDAPAAIFAQGIKKDTTSLRPIQTMIPTSIYYAARYPSQAKTFTIQTQYTAQEETQLAAYILGNKAYDGKTIFICWSHIPLQDMAKALGVQNPPVWPHGYKDVWVITYDQSTGKVADFKQEDLSFTVDCK